MIDLIVTGDLKIPVVILHLSSYSFFKKSAKRTNKAQSTKNLHIFTDYNLEVVQSLFAVSRSGGCCETYPGARAVLPRGGGPLREADASPHSPGQINC